MPIDFRGMLLKEGDSVLFGFGGVIKSGKVIKVLYSQYSEDSFLNVHILETKSQRIYKRNSKTVFVGDTLDG